MFFSVGVFLVLSSSPVNDVSAIIAMIIIMIFTYKALFKTVLQRTFRGSEIKQSCHKNKFLKKINEKKGVLKSRCLSPGGIHSPGFEAGDTLSCQSLMNADGLYLVSYYALLLNLKLCCCEYYRRRTLTPVLSLVSRKTAQNNGRDSTEIFAHVVIATLV